MYCNFHNEQNQKITHLKSNFYTKPTCNRNKIHTKPNNLSTRVAKNVRIFMLYLLVDTAIQTEFLRRIFQNFRPLQRSFRLNWRIIYYIYAYLCYTIREYQFHQNFSEIWSIKRRQQFNIREFRLAQTQIYSNNNEALHLSPQLTDFFRITELLILPDYRFALRNIGDFFALQLRFKAAY